jgi:hypothetical protein
MKELAVYARKRAKECCAVPEGYDFPYGKGCAYSDMAEKLEAILSTSKITGTLTDYHPMGAVERGGAYEYK